MVFAAGGNQFVADIVDDGNMIFELRAKFSEEDVDLERRLEETRISNNKLDESRYLTDQRIDSNGYSVDITCKLKSVPKNERDINKLCDQLWGNIIKGAFRGIHNI